MNNIVFEHVVKAYGKNVIVNNLNMEIREGERLILLGPSGCGKSTTLRMIAGLEDITSGSLHLFDAQSEKSLGYPEEIRRLNAALDFSMPDAQNKNQKAGGKYHESFGQYQCV